MYLKLKAVEYCENHCRYYGKVYCDPDGQDYHEVCDNCPIDDFITFCENEDDI